jgi:penicillin-binding protein 1C
LIAAASTWVKSRPPTATEDRYFHSHRGVHIPSIFRALAQNMRARRIVSGASTIAMQVARMQSPGSRNIFNKVRESAEALLLVERHGHDRVLRHYLTIAPYGNRVHGIVRAARYYFDKPVEDLSWLQAAFLAGLPQAPGRFDPFDYFKGRRAVERARLILRILHARGLITPVDLRQALASDLRLVEEPHRDPAAMHAVLRLSQMAGKKRGPIIRSTIDLDIQKRVHRFLGGNLHRLRYRGAGNTSALVVDTQSGDVLAHVGSSDYFNEEDRGAIDYVVTKRPPGSALKPFIYALALEKGVFTAASELPDIQIEFPEDGGQAYVPKNISHTFLGPMLLREALANSRNIPALTALAEVGVEETLAFFHKAGVTNISFTPGQYGLGLALGNLHVTLEELCGLFAILANRGETIGFRYFRDEALPESRRILTSGTADLITHILSDPIARQPSFRRGSALEYEYAVAVKTGTSQGYRDAWAVAYSDRLLVGVWVGNHDWRRMNHLGGLVGSARPIKRIMNALMPQHQHHRTILTEFPPPEDYTDKRICALSGKLAGPDCPHHRVEYFKPGSEPFTECPYHQKAKIDKRNGLLATKYCPARFVEERVLVDLPDSYSKWARGQHLELAPKLESPLCGGWREEKLPAVKISAPTNYSRYLWDPDTPAEYSTIRLAADVTPRDEDIIWIVDGIPVAKVGYPHEFRWSLEPGVHKIKAALAQRPTISSPVTVVVSD